MRQAALTLALVILGFCVPHGALADEAAQLFDPGRMYVIKLTLPPASKAALEDPSKWQEYQPGQFSIALSADGTPGAVGTYSAAEDVEIRLKGNYSFRNLTAKSAFKVRFPKANPFQGLRVLTLNNMVNDPSMIRETLAYTAYRGAAIPASRTGYAYVYVNGVDYGIHLNIETMDKIALEKLFGEFQEDVQHLYEGEDGADVHPSVKAKFEVDEGDEDDLSDLEALIAAVNSSGPQPWAQRVAAVADLAAMTKMWAAEKYIGQWDGYAGQEESWTPNNYYLYSDPKGVFQMLPWGNDESIQAHHRLSFDGAAGMMFDLCLADAACRALYRKAVAGVRDAIVPLDLGSLAEESAAMLAPWQAKEAKESSREEWDLDEIENGIEEVRAFLVDRAADATEWLAEEDVKKLGPGGQPSQQSQSLPPSAGGANGLGQALRVGKVRLARRVLVTRVVLATPGMLVQRAKLSTGQGARVVCVDRVEAERPGVATLRCRLPVSVLERLQTGPLGLTLATRFIPIKGRVENFSRWVVLPRT